MPKNTLFLTLRVFSATGGIEKVSRVAGKAVHEIIAARKGETLNVYSMYDRQEEADEKYFPAAIFKGFGKNKMRLVFAALSRGINSKLVILSHSNLLLAGFLIKLFSPGTRLILIAHGIEVWDGFSYLKKYMLGKCDQVLAVSHFTKSRMMAVHGIPGNKITVLNNCLDPFLEIPSLTTKDPLLMGRYGLNPGDTVLLTLARLSSKERYKGYDNVLYAIKDLKEQFPLIKYLIVGKYDREEKRRVDRVISALKLQKDIIFTGFIPDEELAAHYHIADLYVMPSKKEGFGIVFIEAMYYGKPVIAGNKDGSVDALGNGRFGLLINPDDKGAITGAITKILSDPAAYVPNLREVMEQFSYPVYREKLKAMLEG